MCIRDSHNQKRLSIADAKIENLDNVLVSNRNRRDRFLLKSFKIRWIRIKLWMQNFDRNKVLHELLLRLINHTHATAPKHFDNFIALGEGFANQWVR